MKKFTKRVFSPPSIRLNTLIVIEVVALLLLSLGTLFFYARQSLVQEAKLDAEQKLQGNQKRIDNILLEVEQSAGNIYFDLMEHLDQPERMEDYCRRLVQCNSHIEGCAIAFKPNYYPDQDYFLKYVRRDELEGLVTVESFGHRLYTEQKWFCSPMKSCKPTWLNPIGKEETHEKPVIAFCIPILDPENNDECVGVMAANLKLDHLSQELLAAKSTDRSYTILLDSDGTFIIHPNMSELLNHTIFSLADKYDSPSLRETGKVLLGGESGNQSFRLQGETWYVFYKHFVRTNIPGRSLEELNWSIGTIYPKSDIFNEYNHHLMHILIIAAAGLLLFYIFSRFAIRKQLKPLRRLTESALSIAEGNYTTMVPETERKDEVGIFQQNFKAMQDALAADIEKQEETKATLNKRREELRKIHEQIQDDDQVQTTFLHNVTNRMIPPTESILASVTTLCDNYQEITPQQAGEEVGNIRKQSEDILELLKRKFVASHTEETGKEDSHE